MAKSMTIIDRINSLLKEKGWTKYKLAKETGLPQSTITSLFNGKVNNPSIETITKVSEAFGVTTDYLVGHRSFTDEKFPYELDLSDAYLFTKFRIKFGDHELSKNEWEKIIAYIKLEREFK